MNEFFICKKHIHAIVIKQKYTYYSTSILYIETIYHWLCVSVYLIIIWYQYHLFNNYPNGVANSCPSCMSNKTYGFKSYF